MKLDEIIQQPGQLERLRKQAVLSSFHVSVPGIILSYDATVRTAKIQPAIRSWRKKENPPILQDVPVWFPGNFTYTISAGDECLVIFADSCIDGWWQNGGVSSPITARKHDLSDGFAIVGFRSKPKVSAGINLDEKLAELELRIEALEEGGNE